MDILKLLSRTIKPKNRVGSTHEASLPSAGTASNPQLFHDPIPASKGKKRKRGGENPVEKIGDTEHEGLDFFAPAAASKPQINVEVGNLPQPPPVKLMDEDECRQILRSHRLKVILLAPVKLQENRIKKSKKIKTCDILESSKNKDLFPQPLMAFDDLRSTYGISKRLGENLAAQGYQLPTEVQLGSLPLLLQPEIALKNSTKNLSGRSNINLLAVAPTGSGKTLAFLIPAVDAIIQRRRNNDDRERHELQAVIVAPTKELANQIVNEGKKLCLRTGIRVNRMRKGMVVTPNSSENLEKQDSREEEDGDEDELKKHPPAVTKCEILVTTPGLLLSSLSAGSPNSYKPMPTVQTLVLDEADWLLDAQFQDETLSIWNSCTNPDLRVTLWSATMGSNIETLAAATIQSRRNRLGLDNELKIVRLIVGLKDSAIPNVTHRLIYAASEQGKLIAIRQLLHPTSADASQSLRPPFLVFTQTIPRAKALHSELLYDIPAEAGGSTRIAVLHSDLSDSARDHVMTRFRNGEIWVLITTDILSRGVDFRGINGVVSYDVPNSGATYVHRVGRTGRAGRSGGVSVTLYTKEDIPYVKNIANIISASEKQAGKSEDESSIQTWLLDALPTPSKEEKKQLKKYGVKARRTGLGAGKDAKSPKVKMQISTKSGYERKMENNRRGAIEGSRRRAGTATIEQTNGSEWGGIEV
jgi:ATP-dependent RNA helicase DDX52/ROK1